MPQFASKPIWLTEFGYGQGGDSSMSGPGMDVLRTFQLFGPRRRFSILFDYQFIDSGDGSDHNGLLYSYGGWKLGAYHLRDQ